MADPVNARVIEIVPRTPNVKSVRVAVEAVRPFKAGQFARVVLNRDKTLQRYLSISNAPTETGYLEFTKKITASGFSAAFAALAADDPVSVGYPYGAFTLERARGKIAFISGGIGITPIRSMCKFAADRNLDLDITLLYANNAMQDIAFRDDFERMQAAYPRLRVVHVLCEREAEFACVVGMINADIIRKEIPDYTARAFFICGPPPMVEAMKTLLRQDLKVSPDNMIAENFKGY